MKVLIVVDLQNDFCHPDGSLYVKNADIVAAKITRLILQGGYNRIVATQDWHPSDHVSFVEWKPHCILDTWGSEFYGKFSTKGVNVILRKGMDPKMDFYSAFSSTDHAKTTGLGDMISYSEVDVVGVAFDYCVKATAIDAKIFHNDVRVLKDFTASVYPHNDEAVEKELKDCGIEVIYE
jgi:nicotinamidase/pyrazinamidase